MTPTMGEQPPLLERVKAATGPDRELDRDIAVALIGWCLHPAGRQRDDSDQSDIGWTCLDCGADSWGNTGPTGQKRHALTPDYTASLDAALALVERKCPGSTIHLSIHGDAKGQAYCTLFTDPDDDATGKGVGRTASLALLTALLSTTPQTPGGDDE